MMTLRHLLSMLPIAAVCTVSSGPGGGPIAHASTAPSTPELVSPAPVEPAPSAPSVAPPAAPPSGAPSVFTSISFDLRSLPHRGPYDVAPNHIEARRSTLISRARGAAGSPAPRILTQPGSTSFRAEFYGTPAAALAQCRRVVAAVAPPLPPNARVSPRMAVSRPRATACAPIAP